MANVPWATPAVLNRMTLGQLAALGSAVPPDTPKRVQSIEAYQSALEEKRLADLAWDR